jgi:uncharacterized protein with HEPN domain
MPPRDVRKYLFDISRACQRLKDFTAGKALVDYSADAMLRSAVERQFEIIGEALNQALRQEPALGRRISDTSRIVAFRNQLIHGYAEIADDVVWGVLETDLPEISREVDALLAERK